MIDSCGGGWGGHSRLGEVLSVLAHGGAEGRPQVLLLIGPWRDTGISEASEPGGHWGWPPTRGSDAAMGERATRMKEYTHDTRCE